ncbi:MAG: hypothetical protein HY552_01330 [Elusimicrobia bacterium]|nr:hypothetical protein [Elusimicrobiota bacterium]
MTPAWALGLLAVLAACRQDEIATHREPKEVPPASAEAATRPAGPRWRVPRGWKELPGTGMRAATLLPPPAAGKAEVSVIALPGDVGGELANVNRWRGQLGLPPLAEPELAGARSRAGAARVYDFTGPGAAPQRLIAGVVEERGTIWFFKLAGEAGAAAAARPAFREMLRGLRLDAR